MTDTTTEPENQAAPPADWWRDPSGLTEAGKERLGSMQDREAEALDVTSDEHEYVWGFRQDRPHERRRQEVADATANKGDWHRRLGATGHAMKWQPAYHGEARHVAAVARLMRALRRDDFRLRARHYRRRHRTVRPEESCAGPGTAWQNELIEERRRGRFAGAVAQFGRDVKEQRDKAWLREQGIEES